MRQCATRGDIRSTVSSDSYSRLTGVWKWRKLSCKQLRYSTLTSLINPHSRLSRALYSLISFECCSVLLSVLSVCVEHICFRYSAKNIVYNLDKSFWCYRCTGREAGVPREQINLISSYIDGNMVYGSNVKRNKVLRTLSQGKMKVWEHEMLPVCWILETIPIINTFSWWITSGQMAYLYISFPAMKCFSF